MNEECLTDSFQEEIQKLADECLALSRIVADEHVEKLENLARALSQVGHEYIVPAQTIQNMRDKMYECFINYANKRFARYKDSGDMDFADCTSPNLDTFLNSFKVRKRVET